MLTDYLNRTHVGDCRALMRQMIADGVRVNCVVTSPPYFGLRDYGTATWRGGDPSCAHRVGNQVADNKAPGAISSGVRPGCDATRCVACGALRVDLQIGLERTWIRYVARMRGVFRLVRELLSEDGTCWINYGDSYASNGGPGWQGKNSQRANRRFTLTRNQVAFRDCRRSARNGLKRKDLIGIPWRVALALQADGWYLRSDIIWHKPNVTPESVTDRPTKAHEYIFLLSKSGRYYYNADAIRESSSPETHARASRGRLSGYEPPGQTAHRGIAAPRPGVNPKAIGSRPAGWAEGSGSHRAKDHARAKQDLPNSTKFGHSASSRNKQNPSFSAAVVDIVPDRNMRTVWTIPTEPFSGAHFATFPQTLVARCILAGSRPGDTVFDPFMGTGTVAKVATDLGRNFIGCELNPEYLKLHELRRTTTGMPI